MYIWWLDLVSYFTTKYNFSLIQNVINQRCVNSSHFDVKTKKHYENKISEIITEIHNLPLGFSFGDFIMTWINKRDNQ